jgi:phytol kinase
MPKSDWLALVLSFVYVFAVIGAGEGLRRWRGYSADFTRKFIHIGVGMIAWGMVFLFENWYFAIIPPLCFIAVNYVSYRRNVFQAMETSEKRNLGTIYFPISFAIIIGLFWAWPVVLVGGLMSMTWGDALAAVVGQRFGRHPYRLLGYTKSWEGSATMLVVSSLALLPALVVFGSWGWPGSLGPMLLVAAVATLVEAMSVWGIDNLTVPLISALVLYLLVR